MKKIIFFVVLSTLFVILSYPWWSLLLGKQNTFKLDNPKEVSVLNLQPEAGTISNVSIVQSTPIRFKDLTVALPNHVTPDESKPGIYRLSSTSFIAIGQFEGINDTVGPAAGNYTGMLEVLSATPKDTKLSLFNITAARTSYKNLLLKKALLPVQTSSITTYSTPAWKGVSIETSEIVDLTVFTPTLNYSLFLVGTEARQALPVILSSLTIQ